MICKLTNKYPNYRNSVEVILMYENKILVTKRSNKAKVAAGVWNVPAGKVKYEETPINALYREAKEEINLDVCLIQEISVRTLKGFDGDGEPYYRCVFTYLVEPKNNDLSGFKLNNEHSDFAWITKKEVNAKKYESLDNKLKNVLLSAFNQECCG